MKMKKYERKGEWSGYTLSEAKTGWVYTQWSRTVDAFDGLKSILPYGFGGYNQGQDLRAAHNDFMDVGDFLAQAAKDSGKILNHGYKVR